MRFLLPPFSSLLASFCIIAKQPDASTTPPNSIESENLLKLHSFPLLMGLVKKKFNCIDLRTHLLGTPSTPSNWTLVPLMTILWVQQFSLFSVYLLSIYLPCNSSAVYDVMGESVKALLYLLHAASITSHSPCFLIRQAHDLAKTMRVHLAVMLACSFSTHEYFPPSQHVFNLCEHSQTWSLYIKELSSLSSYISW